MKSSEGTRSENGSRYGFRATTPLRLASIAVQNIESRLKLPWRKESGTDEQNIKEIGAGGKREPSTGAEFPGRVCRVGDRSSCVDLTGVGVRKKRLLVKDIKVYAVGVYFDHEEIRRTANKADREDKVLDGLLEENGKNVIRLEVIYSRATGKQIAKALDDQIGRKLRQSGHYKDFEDFTSAFDGAKFRKGTTITFSTARNGDMTTFINGEKKNTVKSKPLNQAMTQLYLGSDTITKDLRADALQTISHILTS